MTCAMAPQSASLRMSLRKACEYWFGVLMRWMSVGSEGSKEKLPIRCSTMASTLACSSAIVSRSMSSGRSV